MSQQKLGWTLLKIFYDVFELSPSPISIVWYRKICEAFPRCVLGEFQLRPIEIIVRLFQIVFKRNWSTSFRNFSKTFRKCVSAEVQLHHAENIVRHFEILLSRNSITSSLKYSMTFSTCVLAESRMHAIELMFKDFQFVC